MNLEQKLESIKACGEALVSAKIADIIRKHYTAKEISEALVL